MIFQLHETSFTYALYDSVVNIFNLSYFNEKLFCTYRTLRNKIVTIRSPRKWRIQRYLDQTWGIKSKTIMAVFTKQKMSFYFFFIPSITLSNRAWGHNPGQPQGGNWSAYISILYSWTTLQVTPTTIWKSIIGCNFVV